MPDHSDTTSCATVAGGDRLHLTAEAVEYCDENTNGVVAVLGSTFDGSA